MTLPAISPRSLLFALQKIDLITDDELKQLDKEWKRFRKNENLDARGHISATNAEGTNRGSS
jgi:ribosome biogenesis GTPase A